MLEEIKKIYDFVEKQVNSFYKTPQDLANKILYEVLECDGFKNLPDKYKLILDQHKEQEDKYQNALNDIINNCKDFKIKNDSFWLLQELINQHKEQEDKYKKENIKTMKQLKKELEESSFTVELPLDSYSKYDAKVLEVDDILEILGELNIERNNK